MPYIGRGSDFGVRSVFHFLASNGDTSVSGADADGKNLNFPDGNFIDVYLNGVRLKSGEDYNTATANTVAGLSALNANDEVNIVVYDTFTVADTVQASTGGTFSGAVTISTDLNVGDDLSLTSDSAVLSFGADSDITVTHDPDDGLILKSTATGDDNPFLLTLQTGETDIAADDIIGAINFQAPDEGTGTDAILVAAGIEAVSEGDFSSSSNATKLSFKTGSSETATEKMSIASTGATTITTTGNEDSLTLASTDADANSGPHLVLDRQSSSPADSDFLGQVVFRGKNDAGENIDYATIRGFISDASDGTEDTDIDIVSMVGGTARNRFQIAASEIVLNQNGVDVDFRVEGDGNTHLIHADGAADRVGINSGKTDLSSSSGNYAVLNVGGAESNAGQQAIYCTGSKTSYAGASYNLLQNGLGVGDSSSQATGTGGALTFTGKFDSSSDQVHAATIEGYKRNGTDGEYGFNMVGRTRSNGNATMQTGFVFGPDTVQFYTANTHRFNIDNSGNLTATDTSIGSLSDERLKTNIKDHTYSLDTFKKFDVKTFDWKNPEEHGNRSSQTGLIAQEVEKVDPNFVYEYEVVEGAKDREHLTTTQISRKYTDDMDGKEKTEVRDVKLAKASKLNQKDAMYISVIQQLLAKNDALEARIKKLEDG